MRYLMYYLIIINIAAWLMYGLDKWKAKSCLLYTSYC